MAVFLNLDARLRHAFEVGYRQGCRSAGHVRPNETDQDAVDAVERSAAWICAQDEYGENGERICPNCKKPLPG